MRFAAFGHLLLIGMEAAWLAALMLAFDAALPAPGEPRLAAIALAMPAAYGAGRLLRAVGAPAAASVAVCIGALAAILYALSSGFPADELPLADLMASAEYKRTGVAMLLAAVAWLRGWLLPRRRLRVGEAATSFQFGLVAMLMAVAGLQSMPEALGSVTVLFFAFFAFALLALWQARDAAADVQGARPRLDLAVLGLALVLGVGVALAASLDRRALEPLVAVPAWLGGRIMDSLRSLSELAPELPESSSAPARSAPPPQEEPGWVQPLFAFIGKHDVLLGLATYAAIIAVAAWLAARYRRRRRKDAEMAAGIVYRHSSESLGERLRRWWREALFRAAQALGRMHQWLRAFAWLGRGDRSVRWLYHDAQRRLGRRGLRRSLHESPEEHARRLAAAWPGDARAFERLTAAFVADRYGPRRLAVEEVRPIWKEARRDLRRMKRRHD